MAPATPLIESASRSTSGSAALRRVRDPARDRPQVPSVGVAEATAQRPLFVADHEQVEGDRHRARVHEERHRYEQPRLARDNQERGEVDGIAHPPVGADGDEPLWRVPWTGSAASRDREDPDAPQLQGGAGRQPALLYKLSYMRGTVKLYHL